MKGAKHRNNEIEKLKQERKKGRGSMETVTVLSNFTKKKILCWSDR